MALVTERTIPHRTKCSIAVLQSHYTAISDVVPEHSVRQEAHAQADRHGPPIIASLL